MRKHVTFRPKTERSRESWLPRERDWSPVSPPVPLVENASGLEFYDPPSGTRSHSFQPSSPLSGPFRRSSGECWQPTLDGGLARGLVNSQLSAAAAPVVAQRLVDLDVFFAFLRLLEKRLGNGAVDVDRLNYWNTQGTFDGVAGDKLAMLARMEEYNQISRSSGRVLDLEPGQLYGKEKLPHVLSYFNDFAVALPDPSWGRLHFVQRFEALTKHGWISTNVPLPPDDFNGAKLAVHVILAIKDNGKQLVVNPHVTVRIQAVQDRVSAVAMLNDPKLKTKETKKLGLLPAQSSSSLGMASDREAERNIGISVDELHDLFPLRWLLTVFQTALAAAPSDEEQDKRGLEPRELVLKTMGRLKLEDD